MIIVGSVVLAAAVAVLLKQKIEKIMGPVLILMVLIVNLFLKLDHIVIGVYTNVLLVAISLVFFAFSLFKKRNDVAEYVFTYGGISIILCILFLGVNDMGRAAVTGADPFFWVGNTKRLYYGEGLSLVKPTIDPYFLYSLGYMAAKTWIGWSDGIILFGRDFLVACILISVFAVVNKEKSLPKGKYMNAFTVLMIVLFFPFLSYGDHYGVYHPDYLLAVFLLGALVYLNLALEDDNLLSYSISVLYFCAASLSKRIGVVCIAFLFVLIIPYLHGKGKRIYGLVYVLSILASYFFFWKIQKLVLLLIGFSFAGVLIYELGRKFLKIHVNNCVGMALFFVLGLALIGTVFVLRFWISRSAFSNDVSRIYIKSVFTTYRMAIGNAIPISVATFLTLVVLLYLFIIKKQISEETAFLIKSVLCFDILYVSAFYCYYIVSLAESSFRNTGEYLNGFERYVSLIVVITAGFMCYCILKYNQEVKISILLVMILLMLVDYEDLHTYYLTEPARYSFEGLDRANLDLKNKYRIAYIDMNRDYYSQVAFDLECIPSASSIVVIDDYISSDGEIDDEALRRKLEWNDYVYLDYLSDEFIDNYGNELFGTGDIIMDTLYRYDSELSIMVPVE